MSVYLYLFNGRTSPSESLDDWGERGPVLGPFSHVHTTFAADIALGPDGEILKIVEDCVYYGGMYYGDWSVFTELEGQTVEVFDERLAVVPEVAND